MAKSYNLEDSPLTLGPNDLLVKTYDSSGALFDPFEITASILTKDAIGEGYTYSTNTNLLDIVPIRDSIGYYYLPIQIDSSFAVDCYKVEWSIRELATTPLKAFNDYFVVVRDFDC